MAPFEALYGRRCRTSLSWSEPGERRFFGVDLVKETEDKVRQIQSNLKIAQSRQKSYADKRRRPLVFNKGDFVYLKVSPMKGVNHFGVEGKLAPRYIGPFQILERYGKVAYRLKLPEHLSAERQRQCGGSLMAGPSSRRRHHQSVASWMVTATWRRRDLALIPSVRIMNRREEEDEEHTRSQWTHDDLLLQSGNVSDCIAMLIS